MRKNSIYIKLLCGLLTFFFCTGHGLAAADKQFTVVIDPGHGGHDPGALGKRGKEKNINLSVALKLGRLIEDNMEDTRVVYTRKKDQFIPLLTRAEIANREKADLFISIHTNSVASRSSKVSGTETYTLGLHRTQENLEVAQKENAVILIEEDYKTRYAGFNPNSSESYIIFEFMQDQNMSQSVGFAQLIQHQFRHTAQRVDKGVHQAGFLVLRETSMPSVLIELGYITNPAEEAYLLSEAGSSALAQSIYQAFRHYKQQCGTPTVKTDVSSPAHISTPRAETAASSHKSTTGSRSQCQTPKTSADSQKKPVFKIQILTSDRKLPASSRAFKGLSGVAFYKEKGIYKYTYGESTNYNEVLRLLRNKVSPRFKDAFIIAFKEGEKMNVNEAIREFKRNR